MVLFAVIDKVLIPSVPVADMGDVSNDAFELANTINNLVMKDSLSLKYLANMQLIVFCPINFTLIICNILPSTVRCSGLICCDRGDRMARRASGELDVM